MPRRPPPPPPPAKGPAPRELHPVALPEAAPAAHPPRAAHPAPRRPRFGAGDALYLSATLLATLWAMVLLFVVYPQSPVDAGFAADDVPVVSLEGSVVTVKRSALEEALASRRYLAPSQEQVEYFEARRAATLRDVKRDKLFWYLAGAAFPGVALLLFHAWYKAQRRG